MTINSGIPGMNPQKGNSTFSPPPLDGSLQPAEIIDYHIQHSPNWVYAKWLTDSGVREFKFIEFGRAVHQCARDVANHLSCSGESPALERTKAPVIAVFGNGPTLSYFALVFGIVRAGAVPFPISTNNSKEALVHLLEATDSTFVVGGPGDGASPEVEKVLTRALETLEARQQKIGRIPYPSLDRLLSLDSSFQFLPPPPKRDWKEPCVILHSSGSTSFPKPITYTLFTYLSVFRSLLFGDESVLGWTAFIGHLPPFHAMAFQWGLAVCLGSGLTNGLRDPRFVKPSAAETVLPEVEQIHSDVMVAVPSFYQTWVQDSSSIQILKRLRSAVTSGGPISSEVATTLEKQGLHSLITVLGSTEACVISKFPSLRPHPEKFEQNPQVNLILREQPDTETSGQYEMLIGSNGHYSPNVFNDTHDGKPVYATNDLIVKTEEDGRILYQVVGRADDQLMHSSGEKTNPGPLQDILLMDPLISGALYFGRGKQQVGVLIELSKSNEIELGDEAAVAKSRNAVWPSIQKANAFAPSHSACTKEMILFASSSKPFSYTAKGSVRGGAILKEYAPEIENLYQAVDDIKTEIEVPSVWNNDSALKFISQVVEEALSASGLVVTKDIFSMGCDSLKATRIRNVLSKSVENGVRLAPDLVYSNPTISSLTLAVLTSISGEIESSSGDSHIKAMKAMINKYSSNWPTRSITLTKRSKSEVVILTGSTGGLGATLLSQLLQNSSVSHVFAVNRGSSSSSLADRQAAAFKDRGLDLDLLNSKKLRLVEAKLDQDRLGLDELLYSEIRDSATLIIHNSWRLDFNLSLRSFEEHVKGSRNLIDLALLSPRVNPPKYVFTSSIASVGGFAQTGKRVPEEDFFDELEVSVGGGYGESKAVTERILVNASHQTGLESSTVRIGQISGSKSNGSWSPSDWLPLIVQSGKKVQCLPNLPNQAPITWISSDDVSSTILDFGFAKMNGEVTPPNSQSHQTLHIVHPNPVTWDSVFEIFSQELQVPLVSYSTWLSKLKNSKLGLEELPAKKLLSFFQGVSESSAMMDQEVDDASEAMGIKRLDTTKAERISESLRNAAQITTEDVKRWSRYWIAKGLL